MKVEIGTLALRELEDAADFYADRASHALANDFLKEFERVVDIMSINPLLGSQFGNGFRRCRLRRFPYSLIYRISPSVIRILAVAHDRRKPNYWRSRK